MAVPEVHLFETMKGVLSNNSIFITQSSHAYTDRTYSATLYKAAVDTEFIIYQYRGNTWSLMGLYFHFLNMLLQEKGWV